MSEVNTTEVTISPSVVSMGDALAAAMVVGESGVVEAPADRFEQTLPEGLSVDTAQQYQKHQADYIAATTLAVGKVGEAAMAKDKTLTQVSYSGNALKDTVSVTLQRSKTMPVPGKKGETMTVRGQTTVGYTVRGAENVGDLKKVRTHIKTQFLNLAD